MQFTAMASIAASVVAGAALAATAVLLVTPQADPGARLWFDYPVAAGQVVAGQLTVSTHTDVTNPTAITVAFFQDGKPVATLTDTALEFSGQGPNAVMLYRSSAEWDAPVGEYQVIASVYRDSTVVNTRESKLSVIGPLTRPLSPLPAPQTPAPTPGETGPEPSAAPTPTATVTAAQTPSSTPEPTTSTTPAPSKTPKPTPTETPGPTPTKTPGPTPSSTPAPTTIAPTPTPDPPPPPLGGTVTRIQLDDHGWKNTFTVAGLRPGDAAVWVEVNLHNTQKTPYYNGWQSYPCGSMTLESGSGASATYSCTATFTIEPPSTWKSGSGEFRFWFEMPASVYRSKVVTSSKTVYGTGGNWTVAEKQA
ncbi:MAG: hypothetical protein KIT69_19105 [Propionibacteriaceae bacterium]|nr:hypothetical protein [Propionibacteriaceae bacterium]